MTHLKQQTIETYDRSAGAMKAKFNAIGARVQDIERGFSFVKNDRPFVFEIGCGNGRDAQEILKRTDRYVGIDLSSGMIDLARQDCPEGMFEVQDVETASFPSGIDLVFSFASLLHSPPERVLEILTRLHASLNEGGIIYLSLKHGEGSETKEDAFGTRTFYYYTPDAIESYTGQLFSILFQDVHELRGQQWFTLVLQK